MEAIDVAARHSNFYREGSWEKMAGAAYSDYIVGGVAIITSWGIIATTCLKGSKGNSQGKTPTQRLRVVSTM